MGIRDFESYLAFAEFHGIERKCLYCGEAFTPRSPNQKMHSWVDASEAGVGDVARICRLERELEEMSPTQYLVHIGLTRNEYIEKYGLEEFNSCVIRKEVPLND